MSWCESTRRTQFFYAQSCTIAFCRGFCRKTGFPSTFSTKTSTYQYGIAMKRTAMDSYGSPLLWQRISWCVSCVEVWDYEAALMVFWQLMQLTHYGFWWFAHVSIRLRIGHNDMLIWWRSVQKRPRSKGSVFQPEEHRQKSRNDEIEERLLIANIFYSC